MIGIRRRLSTRSGFVGVAVVLLICTAAIGTVFAATAGPSNPTTASNVTGVGTVAWGSPSNVLSSNNVRASAALGGNSTSNWIQATGFGFSIPNEAVINGITIGVEQRRTGSGAISDNASRLVKGGVIQATDVLSASAWSTTEGYVNRGSTSNLWGTTWLPSDINSSDFGYALSAKTTTATAGGADVDHIRATITYTLPTYQQSAYRFFANADSTNVGSALAAANTVPSLATQNSPFRLRMLIHVATAKLRSGSKNFKLQYAKKGSGTCAAPTGSSYADVSGSTPVRFYDNPSVSDGTLLTTNANDPAHSTHTKQTQSYDESNPFTNPGTDIASGQDGIWDFALIDTGATGKTRYCFRAVAEDGTAFGTYTVYPEVLTAGTSTSADIVDSGGSSVSNPAFAFDNQVTSSECATSTGTFGDANQEIRVSNNSTAENWSLALAATNGATDTWNGTIATYDFNDSGGCNDTADADSVGGRLTVNPAAGTITPTGCTNTGISLGSQTAFTQGTTNSITIMSGTTGTGTNCSWDLTGVGLSQSIPPERPAATYELPMTLTLTVS